MTFVSLVAATLALAIGATVLWANPARLTNRIFSAIWFMFTVWFGLVHQAVIAESMSAPGEKSDATPWLRANSALIALAPLLVWMLKESIASASTTVWHPLRRSLVVAAATLVLFGLSYTDSFVLPRSSDGTYPRGLAYSLYILIDVVVYTLFVVDCCRQIRNHRGIQRLELQWLAMTTGTTCLPFSCFWAASP